MNLDEITPDSVRIDASAACDLQCPRCPVGLNADNALGIPRGTLRFADFRALVERNPWIRRVELANWGEAFLNKELPDILRLASEHDIAVTIDKGTHFNRVSPEALEALVKYRVRRLRVAVDGATPETYARYRVGGDLRTVLANLRRLNDYKRQYGSPWPEVVMQFILFPHNEHEAPAAIVMARLLGLKLHFHLNNEPAIPLKDPEQARRLTGYADRDEFVAREGRDSCYNQCYHLFRDPQFNSDGTLLGCGRNYWLPFSDTRAFEADVLALVNNEKMRYARRMVLGEAPPRADIPCTTCQSYRIMQRSGRWITPGELA